MRPVIASNIHGKCSAGRDSRFRVSPLPVELGQRGCLEAFSSGRGEGMMRALSGLRGSLVTIPLPTHTQVPKRYL